MFVSRLFYRRPHIVEYGRGKEYQKQSQHYSYRPVYKRTRADYLFLVYNLPFYTLLYVAFNTAEDVRYRTICTDCLFFPAEKVA